MAELGPWDAETDCRLFDGATQLITRECLGADIEMTIVATQYADGRVEREITVDRLHRDNPISIVDVRRIVVMLTTAMTRTLDMEAGARSVIPSLIVDLTRVLLPGSRSGAQ